MTTDDKYEIEDSFQDRMNELRAERSCDKHPKRKYSDFFYIKGVEDTLGRNKLSDAIAIIKDWAWTHDEDIYDLIKRIELRAEIEKEVKE